MYCLAALDKCQQLSDADVQKMAFAGTRIRKPAGPDDAFRQSEAKHIWKQQQPENYFVVSLGEEQGPRDLLDP
jgi:hypothetical protein